MAAETLVRKDTHLKLAAGTLSSLTSDLTVDFMLGRTVAAGRESSAGIASAIASISEYGRQVASLFGVLRSADEPEYSASGVLLGPPLKRTRLQLVGTARTLSVLTDLNGSYAFYNDPPGEYRIAVSLPPNTVLLDNVDKEPLQPIDLLNGACDEYDVTVLPTGRIRGRVVGADGNTLSFDTRRIIPRRPIYSRP